MEFAYSSLDVLPKAQKLGLEACARIFVPHPVIDPLAPVATKAAGIIEDVIKALTSDELPAATVLPASSAGEEDEVVNSADCAS